VLPERLTIHTKHAELSLEDVAAALPGTGDVMRSVSHCFAMCWHAAAGGNRDLAAYFLRRTRNLLRGLVVTRPKYAAQVADYDVHFLEPLYQAVLAGDRRVFEARFERAVAQANVYHVDTGHPYIRWSVPAEPPDRGLDLSAGG
jgi:hypothetical protein